MIDTKGIDDTVTKKYVLLVTTLAAFLGPFSISSVNISLPVIGRDLQIDAILLSWVTTIYLLTSAMLLVPLGKNSGYLWKKTDLYLWQSDIYSCLHWFCLLKLCRHADRFPNLAGNWISRNLFHRGGNADLCVSFQRAGKGFWDKFSCGLSGEFCWTVF